MSEEWRTVPWFERYEVSDRGQVRSWFVREGVRRRFPVYRKIHIGKDGYARATLCEHSHTAEQRVETWLVHRLVAMVFRPCGEHERLCVAHLDGDRLNNDLSNLAWVTRRENEAHKEIHGTKAVGTRNGQAKIDERIARAIRELVELDGLTQARVALRFGISQQLVSLIVRGKSWTQPDALIAALATNPTQVSSAEKKP